MPPKLTAPPRTATPLFRVLRTRALALFVSALLAPLLASTVSAFPQQTSSAPQSDQPPPIQRER
ncbi:MAG TPA: hypothetical protein VJP87_05090, partial [Candidatus Acidoferrales bacterium]|nr:hypothetical protein [Candidatus Acidoferrales bacterium]